MNDMTGTRDTGDRESASPSIGPALPIDESRLTMMRDVKRMSLEKRIALLDQLCREGTRIAIRARRIK